VEWIDKVIFASLSPDNFEAVIAEGLRYNAEFSSALLEDRGVDNTVDSDFNVVR
jgi:hypothetical protein